MILGKSLLFIFSPKFSWATPILLLVSLLAVTVIIERFIYYLRRRVDTDKLLAKVKEIFRTGGISEVLAMLRRDDSPQALLIKTGFENYDIPEDMLVDTMESTILEQRVRLERFLSGLGTIGYVAPLIGLFGTVTGLIRAFYNIATTGSGGVAVVSGGVSEALVATAFGLLIAVPCIYFFNYFSKKSADTVDEMESLMRKLMKFIATSKGGHYEVETTPART